MSTASLLRRLAPRRLQLSPVNLRGGPDSSRTAIKYIRLIDASQSCQRRTLLTAVTNSPNLLTKYPANTQPPLAVLPTLVDAAISWAAEHHTTEDPPSEAIILVHKALIPQGQNELFDALSQSTRLGGLNALVGVVDTVGEGAKGVSVLLASKNEAVEIDTLEFAQNEVLRVGKWHAMDIEKEETINFDDILASIREGANVSAAKPASGSKRLKGDSVFVLGEMEAVQTHASLLNQRFPSADIVLNPCRFQLTEDGNHLGTNANDQFPFHNIGS